MDNYTEESKFNLIIDHIRGMRYILLFIAMCFTIQTVMFSCGVDNISNSLAEIGKRIPQNNDSKQDSVIYSLSSIDKEISRSADNLERIKENIDYHFSDLNKYYFLYLKNCRKP